MSFCGLQFTSPLSNLAIVMYPRETLFWIYICQNANNICFHNTVSSLLQSPTIFHFLSLLIYFLHHSISITYIPCNHTVYYGTCTSLKTEAAVVKKSWVSIVQECNNTQQTLNNCHNSYDSLLFNFIFLNDLYLSCLLLCSLSSKWLEHFLTFLFLMIS